MTNQPRMTAIAQKVAAVYGPGVRVVATDGPRPVDRNAPPRRFGTMMGTVQKFVPATNAQGGTVIVLWDNGHTGRMQPAGLAVAEDQSR